MKEERQAKRCSFILAWDNRHIQVTLSRLKDSGWAQSFQGVLCAKQSAGALDWGAHFKS